MDPLIAYFKQQKPELEPYLSFIEQWKQIEQDDEGDNETIDITEDDFEVEGKNQPEEITVSKSYQNQLVKTIRSLKGRLKAERELTSSLAEALGACPDCFGEDEDCDYCAGEGVPGYEIPDYELFVEYIVPAIRSFNLNYQKNILKQ